MDSALGIPLMWWLGLAVLLVGAFFKLKARPFKGVGMTVSDEFFFGSTRGLYKFMKAGGTLHHYRFEQIKLNGWKAFGWSLIGGKQGCILVEPEDIKYLLKDNFNGFEKSPEFLDVFEELLGDGIFNTNGEKWKEQRVVAAHMFNRRQLRERMSAVFGTHSQEMVQLLRKHVETSTPVDVQSLFYHFTFDSINNVAFNRCVSSLKGTASDCEFQEAFDTIQGQLLSRPIFKWWRINRRFNLSQAERTIKKNVAIVNKYINAVVAEYYDDDDNIREEKLEGDQTMTGLFLEHAQAEAKTYSRKFLRDMILNFIIAGRDTTGSALTSCIEFLCKHPEWQARIHEEALNCFNGNLQEALTFDDLEGKSPVAEAVLMESLRLHPSVPVNGKFSLAESTFPSGITVPKGVVVSWLPLATNQYAKYWGADAEEFKPDRWLEGRVKPDDFMYPTFHGGPRLCLGKNMAILEAKIALLTLLAHYRFSMVDGFEPTRRPSVTWQLSEAGLMVNVHPAC